MLTFLKSMLVFFSINFIYFLNSFTFFIKFSNNVTNINLLVSKVVHYSYVTRVYLNQIWLHSIVLNHIGDIEPNPGPKPITCESLSIYH